MDTRMLQGRAFMRLAVIVAMCALGLFTLVADVPRTDARASYTTSLPVRSFVFDRTTEPEPDRVSITVSEAIDPSGGYRITVKDDANLVITTGQVTIDPADPTTMSIALRPGYSQSDPRDTGAYYVAWSVRSAVDRASTASSFKFCYGERGFTLCDGGHIDPGGPARGTPIPTFDLGAITMTSTPTATNTATVTTTPTATRSASSTPTSSSTSTATGTSTPTVTPVSEAAALSNDATQSAVGSTLGVAAAPDAAIAPPDTGSGGFTQTTARKPTQHWLVDAVLATSATALGGVWIVMRWGTRQS